jgi:conjugal transfer pilus assembly protein TrbC
VYSSEKIGTMKTYSWVSWIFLFLLSFSMKSSAQFEEPQVSAVAPEGDVLIFVSFSMPEKSLGQWFEQAKKIHAPLIFRGLVHDSLKDTQARFTQFTSSHEEEDIGMTIEPRLFSEYGITKVPAVVIRDTSQPCFDETCAHAYPFDVVTGDVGLSNALRKIGFQEDGAVSQIAKKLLQSIT